jgi:hypothetical protein
MRRGGVGPCIGQALEANATFPHPSPRVPKRVRDLLPGPGRPQVVKASACRIERDVLDY